MSSRVRQMMLQQRLAAFDVSIYVSRSRAIT